MLLVRWLAAPRKTSGAELCEYSSRKWCSTSPRVVVAKAVGELDLVEAVLEEFVFGVFVPRPRELVFIEDPEFHGRTVRACGGSRAAREAPATSRTWRRQRAKRALGAKRRDSVVDRGEAPAAPFDGDETGD